MGKSSMRVRVIIRKLLLGMCQVDPNFFNVSFQTQSFRFTFFIDEIGYSHNVDLQSFLCMAVHLGSFPS
jgi:hypothetical protein